jgi:cytochrome c peroxidase
MGGSNAFASLAVALGLASLAWGCDEEPAKPPPSASATPSAAITASAQSNEALPPPPTWHGGSIVHAANEEALWVADEDRSSVARLQLPLSSATEPVATEVPGHPAQVLALADKLLVTIRDPSMLVIMSYDGDHVVEQSRVSLPADAWGVVVTRDQTTALVTSAWAHQVSSVDLASAKLNWSVDVAREPRAIIINGDHAYVTHLMGTKITRIDNLTKPQLTRIELPPARSRAPRRASVDASLAYSATLSPDGKRFFVARHALGALGSDGGFVGQPTWFGASTVDVMLTGKDEPLAPKRSAGKYVVRISTLKPMAPFTWDGTVNDLNGEEAPLPGSDVSPFVQPRSIVYRSSQNTVLVSSEGDDRIVELDALALEPALHVVRTYQVGAEYEKPVKIAKRGGAPSGMALSADEQTAYVYCRSTNDVTAVDLDSDDKAEERTHVSLGEDPLLVAVAKDAPERQFREAAVVGKKLFFNAVDINTSGGMGCAGCHPDGRDDGHVWREVKVGKDTNFVGGHGIISHQREPIGFFGTITDEPMARQTPMLVARVSAKGPYGWHGESKTLVARIADGMALHRWGGRFSEYGRPPLEHRARAIAAYLLKGPVAPPKHEGELSPSAKRGRELFMGKETGCTSCHSAETDAYTDRMPIMVKLPPREGYADESRAKFKTPSLRYVANTPPYFHDGSVQTLDQLIAQNNNRMGKTNHLSAGDQAALVEFLKTL